jgi:Protein of unknown function (DUF1579)
MRHPEHLVITLPRWPVLLHQPPGGHPLLEHLGYPVRGEHHLWVYEGSLDSVEKVPTLHAEGPSCAGDGTIAKYRDVIEIVNEEHRTLTSHMLGADGSWTKFMTAHYFRKG